MSRLWRTNTHGKVVQYPVWAESAIAKLESWHWGVVIYNQIVTWTAFTILAMFYDSPIKHLINPYMSNFDILSTFTQYCFRLSKQFHTTLFYKNEIHDEYIVWAFHNVFVRRCTNIIKTKLTLSHTRCWWHLCTAVGRRRLHIFVWGGPRT